MTSPSCLSTVRILLTGLAALAAGAARADDDPVRSYLPDGTRIVCVVNVQTLLAAPLIHKNAPGLKDAAFAAVKSHALQDVHQVTAAYPGAGLSDRATVIVRGKIDAEAFEKEMKDGAAAGRVKVHETPAGRYYEQTKPDRLALGAVNAKMFVAVLDDKTMVISFGDEGPVQDALGVKSGSKKPAENKAVNGLLDRLDAKDALGLVMSGAFQGRLPAGIVPEPLMAVFAPIMQEFQGDQAPAYDGLIATLRVEDDVKARATALTADAEAARRLGKAARDGLMQLRDTFGLLTLASNEAKLVLVFLNSVKVEETDTEVTVTGTMPAAPAALLVKQAAKAK